MKYRWGFLDENDIFAECQPKVDDSTAIDFSQESNEMFYRGKINGSLAFRFEFDDILAKGYNYEHRIVLQWYDADNDEWKEVWKGRFALTDCEIDFDTKTITVQPTTLDRYTEILDGWEKEYNLVKLAPQQRPVDILIRPLMQLYEVGDSKISNYIGNNYWEKDCEMVARADIDNYKFGYQKQFISATIAYSDTVNPNFPYRAGKTITYVGEVIYGGMPQENTRVQGQYWDGSAWQTDTLRVRVAQYTTTTDFQFYQDPDTSGTLQTPLFTATYGAYGMGTVPTITINLPTLVNDALSQWDMICARILVQTDLQSIDILGTTYTLDDIPATDMAGSNLNYNKTFFADIIEVTVSSDVQDDPTIWGISYNEKYFVKPADVGTSRWMPVGQSLWKYFSVWWRVSSAASMIIINDELTALQTIADSYFLNRTAMKLLAKAGWSGQYWISRVLGGNNDYVGDPFVPVITPKSNVISSYYNTPAQNAQISLAKIFNMLKQAYQIYWHIDSNNNIHVEHISYYDNGMHYSEEAPDVLVDLETELHTNTKSNKVFGQNKVKFEKTDMPEQFRFGWADVQTKPFDGFPINCLDKYIQKGQINEMIIGDFDTDVDFVLSSPNDVSKEGFFLFACPVSGGTIDWKLKVEKLPITDEDGQTYNVEIQNADGAFIKIQESYWRYALPCENVNINNADTTAITTGRFKVQNVEFADSVMAEILKDIDNCNKVIRTQQGDGHIKTLSINLNSLVAKGDLLFNFVGRWYYLKGTALGNSIIIFVNGESTTIEVSANKFTYRYKEPIATLKFNAADVVSVNFADCDKLDNLTTCDEMFDGCEELLAVDFGNKTFSAVTSANNMFRGCVALTTLICPDSSTWKADLDFSDCPALTLDSFYDLIKFLYYYNAGVHTITPNSTMWNALDGDIQNDLIAKATERGWTINIPAQYSVTGESTSSTVYATINGTAVEIPVTGGVWSYDYNAAITSISFENDSNLTKVDFSLSDGLAGLTTLADAFKNCSALTSVDFSNCDLSNVASATDTFAGCTSLTELIVPAGTWKPDVDLSDSAMVYSDMLSTIGMLYTYATGTHTITFNQTTWDSLTQAQQQTIFDAAQLKGWTTNAPMVVYYVRGTSSNVNGQETFTIQFIQDNSLTPDASETITVNVGLDGKWEFNYIDKKIYSLYNFANANTNIESVDFSSSCKLTELTRSDGAFRDCTALTFADFSNCTFDKVTTINVMFQRCTALINVDMSDGLFGELVYMGGGYGGAFQGCTNLENVYFTSLFPKLKDLMDTFYQDGKLNFPFPSAMTYSKVTTAYRAFYECSAMQFDFSEATFDDITDARMITRCESDVYMPKAKFYNATQFNINSKGHINLSIANPNCNISVSGNTCYSFSMPEYDRNNTATTVFYNAPNVVLINLPKMKNSTLAIFTSYIRAVPNLTTLYINSCGFESATTTNSLGVGVSSLVELRLSEQSTIPISISFSQSPLSYASILSLANSLKDLIGLTAQTMTIKLTAWNALSSAEQTNIDTILSGKNWNRAIA